MPIAKPLISIAVAGGVAAAGAYWRTEGENATLQGALSDVQTTVLTTIESGLAWLSTALGTVLPYAMPEVLPNGDIIIRYVPPETPPPADAEPPPDDILKTELGRAAVESA